MRGDYKADTRDGKLAVSPPMTSLDESTRSAPRCSPLLLRGGEMDVGLLFMMRSE